MSAATVPVELSALAFRAVSVPEAKSLVIHSLSDIHIGADRHQRAELQRRLDYITARGPEHRVVIGGDWGDIRNKNGKSFKHGAMTPQDELEEFVRLVRPIADRVDLIIPGNHEERIPRETGLSWMQTAAALLALGDSYRGGPTLLQHRFGGRPKHPHTVRGLYHHGCGGGSTGASVNRLGSMLRSWTPDANYAVMGHVHQTGVFKQVCYLGFPPKVHTQTLFLTGTYVDHEHYAQEFGLAPSYVGCPEIHVKPDGHDRIIVSGRI